MRTQPPSWATAAAVSLILCLPAWAAATRTINFEDLAVGTVVVSQYDGVTFSVVGQSCKGDPPVNLVIKSPAGGTSSGVKALGITSGCPDFSPDYLRMVFDQAQQEVTFTLGEGAGNFRVRAYNAAGVAIATQAIGIDDVGVHRFVRVASASALIKRIDIEELVGSYETIDDLTLACPDITPPNVQITSPAYEDCACGTSVLIRGMACDAEGYAGDTLEYLAVDAAPGTPWTLIASATTPQCTLGSPLYLWSLTAVADGRYFVELHGHNDCGLESSAITVVCVKRDLDTPAVRSPVEAAILGGVVCVDGTVWEGANSACLRSYDVNARPTGGDTWNPVDPATPLYSMAVVNDPLAAWNTRAGSTPDGNYQLRVRSTNLCGENSAQVIRNVIVDNTPPAAVITAPHSCGFITGIVGVYGTASDTHFANWTLQYSGGDAHGWVTLVSDDTPIVGGLLAKWDTRALRSCAYTLRLVVTDAAARDCISDRHNQSEYLMPVYVGTVGHFDYDGDSDVDMDDFGLFQRCFSGPALRAAPECLD